MTFLECLFDANEGTCFTLAPKGTTILSINKADPIKHTYFSINPIDMQKDCAATESWHHPDQPRRCDDNVITFRNILLEMDQMPVGEQREYMSTISLPYSTAVFSGSKSIHFIISLAVPLTTRKDYDVLVKRVYKAVGYDKLDRSCKNPSRLSRFPGHLRADTGKIQTLLDVRERVDNAELENWLILHGAPPPPLREWEDLPPRRFTPKDFGALMPSTRNFLMFWKMEDGHWNSKLFKAAADLCRNGWSEEEAIIECNKILGFLETSSLKTIKSAYRNETKQKEME